MNISISKAELQSELEQVQKLWKAAKTDGYKQFLEGKAVVLEMILKRCEHSEETITKLREAIERNMQ